MTSPRRALVAAAVLAALGIAAVLSLASSPDARIEADGEDRAAATPGREGGAGEGEAALQDVPPPPGDAPDRRAGVAGAADGPTDADSGGTPRAPTMRDVEIVRAEVEARFAGASSDALKEALRHALRGGSNAAAQALLRDHLDAVHAAKLEAGEYEVMDAAALERIGARDLRWSLQPTLFNGQYALHVLPDGRDVRTEVRTADFAGAEVDFELAIETVWIEKLYADALRSE